ncbi:MAG: hypothetical protein FJY88_02760 [Candidatus Eisenbacteria bacterium]|nr:hypothetical protein [Candidatus Eisenbacteria bacterium]
MISTPASHRAGSTPVVFLWCAPLAWLVCFAAAAPAGAVPQCVDYEDTFRFLGAVDLPDYGKDVTVAGDLAYVISSVPCESCVGRLDLFDVSTAGQPGAGPRIQGGIEIPGGPVAVAVVGERAYVGSSGGQIHVIDVSDPLAPSLLTSLPAGKVRDLAATSDLLLGALESGLQIYDLADPDSAAGVGSLAFAGGARSVAVSGTLAFVVWGGFGSGGSGLSIVDVAEPAQPRLLSSIWSSGVASVVAVSDGRAYLGGGFRYGSLDGFLDVIDARDPAHPALEASLDGLTLPISGIAVAGDAVYATAADPWYFTGSFYVVDMSDSSGPILVHDRPLEFPSFAPFVADGIVFFCEHRLTGGLRFAAAPGDVSPRALSIVPWSVPIYSVDAQANLAYLTDSSPALKVMNLSNPANPLQIGTLATPARGEVVEVHGSYAYVGYLMRAMSVIDVSVPQLPRIVATVSAASGVMDMAAGGSWLYTVGWNGTRTIDIANPLAPVARGYLPIAGHKIAVDGSHAYVLDGYSMSVVDVANPAAPTLVGALQTDAARSLAIAGTHALVVDWRGVQIIDVADAANPVEVGRIDGIEDLDAVEICVRDDHVYLARDRLAVVDIVDPLQPALLGESETQVNAWPRDVAVGDQFVLIAGENLRVFPLQCSTREGKGHPSRDWSPIARVAPNPMRDEAGLELRLDRAGSGAAPASIHARVLDVAGRQVARLADGQIEAGAHLLRWDGRRDCDGRPAPAGVYWIRVDAAGMPPTTARVVKLP